MAKKNPFWYALPLIFSIFGGIVAYFILRKEDPSTAKTCLWIGIFLLAFYGAYYVVFSILLDTFEFS